MRFQREQRRGPASGRESSSLQVALNRPLLHDLDGESDLYHSTAGKLACPRGSRRRHGARSSLDTRRRRVVDCYRCRDANDSRGLRTDLGRRIPEHLRRARPGLVSSPGFSDDGALRYKNLYLYGGFFDVLAQLFARVSPLGLYEDRHLVNVAFGLLALDGTGRLGTLLLGRRGGLLAMVLTALTPMFYGHSFNNAKDIPFAALFVWTLCHLLRRLRGRFLPISTWAMTKLAISLWSAPRNPAGWDVLSRLRHSVVVLVASARRPGCARRDVPRAAAALAMVLLGAWVVMLSFWPWGQVSPVINPLRSMQECRAFFVQRDDVVLWAARACTKAAHGVPADMVRIPVARNVLRGAGRGSRGIRCRATTVP